MEQIRPGSSSDIINGTGQKRQSKSAEFCWSQIPPEHAESCCKQVQAFRVFCPLSPSSFTSAAKPQCALNSFALLCANQNHFRKTKVYQRLTYGSASFFTYWARLKTSQCKYHICLNFSKILRCCWTRWNWVSRQEFFYKGFQRSIPSLTAIYLLESASNFVIDHSCECAVYGGYVLLFKNTELLFIRQVTCSNVSPRLQLWQWGVLHHLPCFSHTCCHPALWHFITQKCLMTKRPKTWY